MDSIYFEPYKVVVVGDSNVGKSSLAERYKRAVFNERIPATVAAECLPVSVDLPGGQTVNLQLWDTAGQERFRSIVQRYYRGAHGAFLVFDRTDPDTLASVFKYWKDEIKKQCSSDVVSVVIANKCDLESEVDMEDVQRQCDLYSLPLVETSCQDGQGINCAFEEMARELVLRRQQDPAFFMSMQGSTTGSELNSFMLHTQVEAEPSSSYFGGYCCSQ